MCIRDRDYTESPPAFAGNHKEHDHGQGKGIQQGSEETTGKDPEGEKGRKTGQETRIGRRSDDSPLILIRRDWSASGYPNIRIPYLSLIHIYSTRPIGYGYIGVYLLSPVAGPCSCRPTISVLRVTDKELLMKRFLIASTMAIAFVSPVLATDVGVSVSIGQPGFYGRLDIGGYPPPQRIYAWLLYTSQCGARRRSFGGLFVRHYPSRAF